MKPTAQYALAPHIGKQSALLDDAWLHDAGRATVSQPGFTEPAAAVPQHHSTAYRTGNPAAGCRLRPSSGASRSSRLLLRWGAGARECPPALFSCLRVGCDVDGGGRAPIMPGASCPGRSPIMPDRHVVYGFKFIGRIITPPPPLIIPE